MNRTEYMRQLESLLQNISATEREEALQYYNENLTMRDLRMNRMLLRHWGILRRWRRILKKIFSGMGTERTATREQAQTAGQ